MNVTGGGHCWPDASPPFFLPATSAARAGEPENTPLTGNRYSPGRVGGRSRISRRCSRSPSSNRYCIHRGCRLNRAAADWDIRNSSSRRARWWPADKRSKGRWFSRMTSCPAARHISNFGNESAMRNPFWRVALSTLIIIDIPGSLNSRLGGLRSW